MITSQPFHYFISSNLSFCLPLFTISTQSYLNLLLAAPYFLPMFLYANLLVSDLVIHYLICLHLSICLYFILPNTISPSLNDIAQEIKNVPAILYHSPTGGCQRGQIWL